MSPFNSTYFVVSISNLFAFIILYSHTCHALYHVCYVIDVLFIICYVITMLFVICYATALK